MKTDAFFWFIIAESGICLAAAIFIIPLCFSIYREYKAFKKEAER